MFDTMTMTKAVGAVCGALLVFLLAGWAGGSLYAVGDGGGHGEEIAQAYVIDTGTDADAAPAEGGEAAPDFETLLVSADAGAGATVFRKCGACHKVDGADGVGPHLNGVVGRAKAAAPGYAYSAALAAMSADAWTPENLDGFLENPKVYMPGTKMAFAGLPKAEDRANVIAYLATMP